MTSYLKPILNFDSDVSYCLIMRHKVRGAILAADIVHLIKYGRLANKDDYRSADMPEFRKYMQLTVILARQISQIEDSDDDVTFLQEIYNFNEEERRLHTFDRDIDTNTIDILGGGSK